MGTTLANRHPTTHYHAREGDKFNADTTLAIVSCASCGIIYAIPISLKRSALKFPGGRDRGWWLCCPLGHEWGYSGPTAEEKLREQLRDERDRSAAAIADADQARADARAQKAAKTRIKNDRDRIKQRVAAGVCPCCNRTFQNLARHMETKHPGYSEDAK